MTNKKTDVIIYTDGACDIHDPNQPGGYAAVLLYDKQQQELSGGDAPTTNNRMELTATIVALESLKELCNVTLYTDSQYVKKGITEWIEGWRARGWQNVKNVDLWKKLYNINQQQTVTWKWVKGHAGVKYNELVDTLAVAEVNKRRSEKSAQAQATDTRKDNNIVLYCCATFDKQKKNAGWGVVLSENGAEKTFSGFEGKTDDYRSKIQAAIHALEQLPPSSTVTVYTDSENIKKGMDSWIHGWMNNGWKNSSKKPVKHKELWQRLYELSQQHQVDWKFLKNRSGHEKFDQAEKLASLARKRG